MIIKCNQNETKLAKSVIFPAHFGGYVRNHQNEQGIWHFLSMEDMGHDPQNSTEEMGHDPKNKKYEMDQDHQNVKKWQHWLTNKKPNKMFEQKKSVVRTLKIN